MKIQRFDALGIEITLDDFQFFHDEGNSEDIFARTQEIAQKYTKYIEDYTRGITTKTRGICHSFPQLPLPEKFSGEQHIHILYQSKGGLITRAHEETHAIDYFGKCSQLNNIIVKELSLDSETNFYLSPWGLEGSPLSGSIFALLKRGNSLKEVLDEMKKMYNLSSKDFEILFSPFVRV